MAAFVWDPRFETGIAHVDEQHRQLVATTNELGDLLLKGEEIAEETLQPIFQKLAAYGRQHFNDEELLMAQSGVAREHLEAHAARHRQFVEQLVALWRSRTAMTNPAETVHGFLAAWLTVHILGEDKSMARQIARIAQGDSASEAYAQEEKPADTSTAILLEALERLYTVLSEQNRNLAESNSTLEERVQARTRELGEAHLKLAEEHQSTVQLLHKVEDAQQQLLQSEKLAAIGQLAAGVAHEINNPVGFVNSNLGTLGTYIHKLLNIVSAYESGDSAAIQTARDEADLAFLREDLPSLLAESREGLGRVTKIVQDLKDFSHVDQAERQGADLNAALESTLNVVWNELKYKAEVVRELAPLPEVECVPAQINQVFMNMLVNAAHAIEQHGRITLRSGASETQVWFEIEDTGKGMSEAVMNRIFEPFFTTKPVGKGTGLGLSISYDIIVKKHGGTLDVRSQPGQGTCFRIGLPRHLPTPA